ncbi:MAG: hypothetical protein FWG91_12235 [Lachnospiraceae bacterium]|nr:hypothetical protein [Lachnospiraceae bacterium]
MEKSKTVLSSLAAITAIISACFGLFYSFGGEQRAVQNIYGQIVTLYGDGIYANDSLMKAGTNKGTDIAILITALVLICVMIFLKRKPYAPFLRCGLLAIILYASTCLVMGVTFNRLFLLYLVQFGSSFFAFAISMGDLLREKSFGNSLYAKRLTGTALFIIITGCSALQWLAFVLPAVISGKPMEIIDIYTTEPTFVIDLAIILPMALYCGIMLLKKKAVAYQIAPIILTLLTGVALCVIFQTMMHLSLGITIELAELIGLVILFVVLGIIALFLNIRLLGHLKREGNHG